MVTLVFKQIKQKYEGKISSSKFLCLFIKFKSNDLG